MGQKWWPALVRACVLGAAAAAVLAGAPAQAADKLKVYVSTGFDGNTWMDASTDW